MRLLTMPFHAPLLACHEQAMRIIEGGGEQDGRVVVALHEGLQLGPALRERYVEQVLAVEMKKIERPQTQIA